MPSRRERVWGGLVGLLVGDALGVPYEFNPEAEIPPLDQIEFDPPPGFPRAHEGTPPGTWSDDGAHALCLLASLLENDRLDLDDFGRRLLNWHDWGYLAVDDRVFDCGIQTRQAIRNLRSGVTAIEAGPDGEQANGNGSLMRMLPLALWHRGSDEELVRDACLQSRVTHGHVRSQACCALYALWARRSLEASGDPWNDAVGGARSLWPKKSALRIELETKIQPDTDDPGRGGGYVVDCLRSARDAVLFQPTYERVVRTAIALGDDTDTTACVAGGIAGIREGIEGIPKRWRDRLRGWALYEPLLSRLLDREPQ